MVTDMENIIPRRWLGIRLRVDLLGPLLCWGKSINFSVLVFVDVNESQLRQHEATYICDAHIMNIKNTKVKKRLLARDSFRSYPSSKGAKRHATKVKCVQIWANALSYRNEYYSWYKMEKSMRVTYLYGVMLCAQQHVSIPGCLLIGYPIWESWW